jgi:nucleotide-binding universal stress UspA family protein
MVHEPRCKRLTIMDAPDPLLCAIDDDEQGPQLVRAARALAASMSRTVRFVHVVMPGASATGAADASVRFVPTLLPPDTTTPSVVTDEADTEAVARAQMLMLRLGIAIHERQLLLGAPTLELRALAAAATPPVLLVGTRGGGPVKAALRGSVSRELLRDAPCPVMVVPPTADPTFAGETIVCGVDDDGRAEDAAVAACHLAEAMGKRLVLAHVTRPVQRVAAAAPHPETSLAADRSPDRLTERAARLLGHARSLVSDRVDVRMMLRRGRTIDGLIDIMGEVDAGAVVVATRGRGLVRAALTGSVAQELASRSPCPVVAVPRHTAAR